MGNGAIEWVGELSYRVGEENETIEWEKGMELLSGKREWSYIVGKG